VLVDVVSLDAGTSNKLEENWMYKFFRESTVLIAGRCDLVEAPNSTTKEN
jgi:hypothetical protein